MGGEGVGARQARTTGRARRVERKLAGEAINRISLLAGTFPNAFPSFGDVDEAWSWYSTSNYYVTRDLPRRHGMPVRRWRPAELAAEQLGADDAG